MKIRKYIPWTILSSLLLSAAPTSHLYGQITRDDVTMRYVKLQPSVAKAGAAG